MLYNVLPLKIITEDSWLSFIFWRFTVWVNPKKYKTVAEPDITKTEVPKVNIREKAVRERPSQSLKTFWSRKSVFMKVEI